METKRQRTYPFPASAGQIGLSVFCKTSAHFVHSVRNKDPCSSMTALDPAFLCNSSMFCVITTRRRPSAPNRSSASAITR